MNILEDENFILWVLFMTTNKQETSNYKQIFLLFLIAGLAVCGWWAYLLISNASMNKQIFNMKNDIEELQVELDNFSATPWFDKLKQVKALEDSNIMMPRSDHVNAIMAIFDELLAVDDSDTANIAFSDFEISLESIRLNWYVTNLRILYQWSKNADKDKPGLIAKFEELDFLDNISIKTYEKSSDDVGYEFTLTANVINNGK